MTLSPYTEKDITSNPKTFLKKLNENAIHPVIPGETGAVNLEYAVGDPMRYNATRDGVADDSTAIQNALDALALSDTGEAIWTPGRYMCKSEVTMTGEAHLRKSIFAYGVELYSTNSIAGFKITGGGGGGNTVYGMKVNHRGNSTANYGFLLSAAKECYLIDCMVEAHGVESTYSAVRIENSTPATASTGSFWSKIIRFRCNKRSGGDSGDIPNGIEVLGNSNAVVIRECVISNVDVCIAHKNHTSQNAVPNSLLMENNSFEAYGTAYEIDAPTGVSTAGARFINNRFEAGTLVYDLTGIDTNQAYPMVMDNNYYISNAGTYMTNPNTIPYSSFDLSITPDIDMQLYSPLRLQAGQAADQVLTLVPGGGDRGLRIEKAGGTGILDIVWTDTGGTNGSWIRSLTSLLHVIGATGISGTQTPSNNLRGTATLSSGTKAVSFGTNESNATYFLVLTGDTAETFTWASKATTGFTINSSNGSSTANVDWVLIR